MSRVEATLRAARAAVLIGVCCAAVCAVPVCPAAAEENTSSRWDQLRPLMFQDRPIAVEGQDIVQLYIPRQAEDAAVVPVLIRTRFDQTPRRWVRNLYLVIDNNPSPVSAAFHFTPDSGRADIETRVRVESHSPVRAIAELDDGALYMSEKSIFASGGCSSPANKDAGAQANVGKMKFRLDDESVDFDRPVLAQVMIQHPNWSGLAANGPTAQFIKQMTVTWRERAVLSAEMDFSISENPNFRFYFMPKEQGELKVDMVDSAELHYTTALRINGAGRPEIPGSASAR
jgi:sulfur-oxidizing protein SoxY